MVLVDDLALEIVKAPGAGVGKRAHRDDRKTRIDLDRRQRVARPRAHESLFERRVRNRLGGANESRTQLAPGRAHFEIHRNGFAPANAAGDKDRHAAHVRQDFLGQHRRRHGTDVTAGFGAFDYDSIDAAAHKSLGESQGRRKGENPRAAVLQLRDVAKPRQSTRQHHVADTAPQTHAAKFVQIGMHRQHVDAEGFTG